MDNIVLQPAQDLFLNKDRGVINPQFKFIWSCLVCKVPFSPKLLSNNYCSNDCKKIHQAYKKQIVKVAFNG